VLRSASVSSMRRTSVPPLCRAKSQLKMKVRAPPICRNPLGDGAKRTRVMESGKKRLSPPGGFGGKSPDGPMRIEGSAQATTFLVSAVVAWVPEGKW